MKMGVYECGDSEVSLQTKYYVELFKVFRQPEIKNIRIHINIDKQGSGVEIDVPVEEFGKLCDALNKIDDEIKKAAPKSTVYETE